MSVKYQRLIRKNIERAARVLKPWPALVGDGAGTIEVPGYTALWYVRAVGSDLPLPVRRGGAPKIEGTHVWVGHNYDDLHDRRVVRIIGLGDGSPSMSEPGVSIHAPTHAADGSDPVHISNSQMVDALVYASGGMNIKVNQGWVIIDGQPVKITPTTVDISLYTGVYEGGASYALVRVGNNGAISIQEGAAVASYADLTWDDVPKIAPHYAAIGIVRLYEGQTALSRTSTNPDVIPIALAQTGQSLTVRELDYGPNVNNVKEIIVSNGTLTNNGNGTVSITTGGGGDTVDIASNDADISAVNFAEAAAPGTPGAGHRIIYAKSDGIYEKDDDGVEVGPFGAGGASFSDAEGDPAAVDETAAADGISTYAARRDHRHQLGTVNLDDLDDVNTTGKTTGDVIYNNAGTWEDYPLGVGSKITVSGNDLRFGNVPGGNYLNIDASTGNMRLLGNATQWEDLRVSGAMTRTGATAPALGAFGPSGGLKVLRFESAHHDEIHFEIQMPHAWKEGSKIYPHVHWTPVSATTGNVVWQLDYSWANIDGTFGAPTTLTSDATAAGGTAWVHKMTTVKDGSANAYIDGTGKDISSMLVCRLHRDAGAGSDTLAADAAFLEVDFHYEVDSFGSDEESIKDARAALLLESGDYLLLESGDLLLTE